MINLDIYTVGVLLTKAVAARGFDYVYPRQRLTDYSCMYVHNTVKEQDGEVVATQPDEWEPGCIVGFLLKEAGVTLEALTKHEGKEATALLASLQSDEVLSTEPEVRTLLRRIQRKQDVGVSWGSAVISGLARAFKDSLARERAEREGSKRKSEALQGVRDAIVSVY